MKGPIRDYSRYSRARAICLPFASFRVFRGQISSRGLFALFAGADRLDSSDILKRMKSTVFAVLFLLVFSFAVSGQSMFDRGNDFDGDGKADYAVTRNENGLKVWHIWRSTAGYLVMQWGVEGDIVTAADYDGDSKTDIAIARLTSTPENNRLSTTYYLASSTGSVGIVEVEAINIVGALGLFAEDYDGDRKADPGIFQWHAIGFLAYKSSSTGTTSSVGLTWFQVRLGDLTGDNRAEVVSHNVGTGEITAVQGASFTIRFGSPGDRWVAADFDGDNKGDVAIFRPSTGDWWWIRSSDSVVNAIHWGVNGDTPVQADYDGDGKTDVAVYRPGSPQSTYWVLGSTAGYSAFGWGVQADSVVTY